MRGSFPHALVAGIALTATASGAGTEGFSELDADGNGVISKGEAVDTPELIQNWAEVDANGDEVVDKSEYSSTDSTPETGASVPDY